MISTTGLRICVVGTSYVGLSMAVLLARKHDVVAYDIDSSRIEMLRAGRSPIADPDIEAHLASGELILELTDDRDKAYTGADFVVVATPTNYDERSNYFDTSSVEQVVGDVRRIEPRAVSVIKSTVPVGFTRGLRDCGFLDGPADARALLGGDDRRPEAREGVQDDAVRVRVHFETAPR